jgi:endo-1,4-beta-xylanase
VSDVAPPEGTGHGVPLRSVAAVAVGVAVEPHLLAFRPYADLLEREFSGLTAENAMKWSQIHPGESEWRFGPADHLVEFALGRSMRVHGHTLVWHQQLPRWVDGLKSPASLAAALGRHIGTLVGRYRGRVASWDVVNEAVTDRGVFRDSIFLRRLGPGYIADAFGLAHGADPAARLYYNDFEAEGLGRKADAVYALVRRLVDDGLPIHGVGLQMHLDAAAAPAPDDVAANVARLAALGLEVRISEMDVRIRRLRARDPLEGQRAVYQETLAACVNAPGFTGVSFWGVTDAHSWIHRRFGRDAPLLFDAVYAPKPAYFGVRDALASS